MTLINLHHIYNKKKYGNLFNNPHTIWKKIYWKG
jgi:hypothetical protein